MDDLHNLTKDELQTLLLEGAVFVFIGLPEETCFGIDMMEWSIGKNFKGIKMIPAGLHFIHYNAASKATGGVAPRTGFFHNFQSREVMVRYWDKEKEDIICNEFTEDEVYIKENLLTVEKSLGAYPYEVYKQWIELSDYVSEELAIMLSPISKFVRSAQSLVSCEDVKLNKTKSCNGESSRTHVMPKKRKWYNGKLTSEESLLPELKPLPQDEIRFTKFPENNYPNGATPSEITKHCLDSTYVLETILSHHKTDLDLLGEIQYAFIAFYLGHSLEAFEHWKNLVAIICSSQDAITKHPQLYSLFVSIVEVQFKEIPEEFLTDIVLSNNFIYSQLRCLFRSVLESDADENLKSKINIFKERLTRENGWDFDNLEEEDDEDAPVVVPPVFLNA